MMIIGFCFVGTLPYINHIAKSITSALLRIGIWAQSPKLSLTNAYGNKKQIVYRTEDMREVMSWHIVGFLFLPMIGRRPISSAPKLCNVFLQQESELFFLFSKKANLF